MICKIKETIEKYSMLSGVSSLCVGVSGGADSICLLDAMNKLKNEYSFELYAVHINHGIRGEEAKRDESFVFEFCKKNYIPLYIFDYDIPALSKEMSIGEEECGRIVRYDCFSKLRFDAVAVAHTLSDSAETMIFNLIRGSGSKALCGITPKREPNIIRPLIECSRSEIEKYCEKNGLSFVTDSTNKSDDYSRNYIRHNILPVIEKINPAYLSSFLRAGNIAREENDYLTERAKELIEKSKDEIGYSRNIFLSSHPAIRKRAFKILLEEKMNKSVEYKHIEFLDKILLNGKGKVQISKDFYASIKDESIYFYDNYIFEGFHCEFSGEICETPYGKYRLIESEKGIDRDKIKNPLVLSSRETGDEIYLKNRKLTKTLKKLFIEKKIDKEKRNTLAVLRDGENIVWVEEIGIDGNYLSDENSKNIITIIKEG